MNFTIEKLYVAYRKAKNEAFRDTNCAHGLKFANYEQNLHENLSRLRRRLMQSNSWRNDPSFIGSPTCIPKSVELPSPDSSIPSVHCQVSEPIEQWARDCNPTNPATADFRPVIDATVDFMVVSALWILEVGHLYDQRLDSRYAVGNRLRRWRADDSAPDGTPGELNTISPNLFAHYFSAYGKWRADGLAAMRSELEDGHSIVAVTMDLRRFYHNVDPSFLLHRRYLQRIGLNLTQQQREFTRNLLDAFSTWNRAASNRYGCPETGIPVGLTASGLIANVLLAEFDDQVVRQISPRHYGRYVDDVFLVLRHEPFSSGEALISWMASRLGSIAEATIADGQNVHETSLRINLPYATGSSLIFAGKKQKVFQLSGKHGLDLINPIEELVRQNASEFRDLPHLPETEGAMAHRALLVTPDAQLEADALRKADAVTLRRSGFAMLLGDLEAYAHDLDPDSWCALRQEFYGLTQRHLIAPKAFFDFSRYLPRIIGLMASCGDWVAAIQFIDSFTRLRQCLLNSCVHESGLLRTCLDEAYANIGKRCIEAVLQATQNQNGHTKRLLQRIRRVMGVPVRIPSTLSPIRTDAHRLLLLDWAREPYASAWLHASEDAPTVPLPPRRSIREVLPLGAIDTFREAAGLTRPHWSALAFPTRPISVNEITSRAPQLLQNRQQFSQVVQALRGIWMPPINNLIIDPATDDQPPHIFVPGIARERPTIAITSLEVQDEECEQAALGHPVLTLERYKKLNDLLNAVVAAPRQRRPNYILLPELSIPRRWLMRIVGKLVGRGVSIIGGVEYLPTPNNPQLVHNQAVVALRTNYPGYPRALVLLQTKAQAAWKEAELLHNLGLSLVPATPGAFDRPVYAHQDFHLGVLVCSDLTDIENRSRFRGKVDCLLVPEWNRDIVTFASLVESAALDVHAFVAQANNRRYGDSRLRGPMKDTFRRDLVRLKGGQNDYFVIEEIPYHDLRVFQSHPTPPDDPAQIFKPFPIGFPESMSVFRRE
jgi:hypothetical protein